MGATDSRKILSRIDDNFKSIRKYCDSLYGQITVLEDKSSKRQYALIEKSICNPSRTFLNYLAGRCQTNTSYLLRMHEYYNCQIAMCSDIRCFFFLVQYYTHTLYDEIIERQEQGRGFTRTELLTLFAAHVELVMHTVEDAAEQPKKTQRQLISNSHVMYIDGELKGLESCLKNDLDGPDTSFHKLHSYDEKKDLYLSPESFESLCRGQKFKAKEISFLQPSLVFSLAMSYLECIVLADLSGVYDGQLEGVDYERLNQIIEEVRKEQSEDIYRLILEMTQEEPSSRLTLGEVKEFLKLQIRKNHCGRKSTQVRSKNKASFGVNILKTGMRRSNGVASGEAYKPVETTSLGRQNISRAESRNAASLTPHVPIKPLGTQQLDHPRRNDYVF